ncbi:uncharacterized protein LOC129572247, partial [Sitodiplosis mosellana]|uniref:uncharacterized protein LOC129572247 n=1 Tax=Sitodiplosis mosellana TaxID=263140 RepID=UPI0024451D65
MNAGDEILKKHLQMSKLRYTSPKVQNEIIQIAGNIILDKIVAKINKSKYFSVLADETTDISGVEQFSICARYVDKVNDKMVLREAFLKFVAVHDVTGLGLSNTLIDSLKDMKLNMSFLRGQGYDGAKAMNETANAETAQKAFMFQQSIQNSSFIIAMLAIHELFSFTQPLSVCLQAKNNDLASAIEMADNLSHMVKEMRENSKTKFNEIFVNASELAKEIGKEITVPR